MFVRLARRAAGPRLLSTMVPRSSSFTNNNSALAVAIAAAAATTTTMYILSSSPAQTQSSKRFQFVADAVETASPSVVYVSSSIHTFFGELGQGGSGFVISEDGFIATNSHVVSMFAGGSRGGGGPSPTVKVTLPDGATVDGEVWATDNMFDLALIKVDATKVKLVKSTVGSSSALRAGEWVVALGSPMNLQNTVTVGVVSSAARQANDLGMVRPFDFIQTDCSINSGNSGGPLCDMDGKVIGINTMKVAGPEGISFAIPIDSAWPVLQQLREFRRVRRPYLGVKMVNLDDRIIAFEKQRGGSGFPADVEHGVLVAAVNAGSPAARGGLQPGDVIVAVDGIKIASANDFLKVLGFEAGKRLQLEVRRGPSSKMMLTIVSAEYNDMVA
jgi:HtrA serine peptidase 2